MLHFLRKFPSAQLVRAAKSREIEKALICPEENRKRVMVSVGDLISAAQTSVASASAAKELILSEKASALLHLQEKQEGYISNHSVRCQEQECIQRVFSSKEEGGASSQKGNSRDST